MRADNLKDALVALGGFWIWTIHRILLYAVIFGCYTAATYLVAAGVQNSWNTAQWNPLVQVSCVIAELVLTMFTFTTVEMIDRRYHL